MDTIYYVYRKDNGVFAGSGTPFFDDETHRCTEIPCDVNDPEDYKFDIELQEWVLNV